MSHLSRLQGDFARFREDFDTVGTHLTHAHSKYDEAVRRLSQLEGKLEVSSSIAAEAGAPPPPPLPPVS